MKQAKIILFNLLIIPQVVLASSMTTGDAYSKSSSQTNTDGENVIIQNNTATAVSNSGNKTSPNSISTGDSTAVSEVNINNGNVEGELKVEVNGEEKILKITQPGNYKLETNELITNKLSDSQITTSESKTKQNFSKPGIISNFEKFLDFILGFFKK